MILRNIVLDKIRAEFATIENLIFILQKHRLSGDDKSIVDGFIIIGHNLNELEFPLLNDVFFYQDISAYVLNRLYVIYDKCQCHGVWFLIELMNFIQGFTKQLRRLA